MDRRQPTSLRLLLERFLLRYLTIACIGMRYEVVYMYDARAQATPPYSYNNSELLQCFCQQV